MTKSESQLAEYQYFVTSNGFGFFFYATSEVLSWERGSRPVVFATESTHCSQSFDR